MPGIHELTIRRENLATLPSLVQNAIYELGKLAAFLLIYYPNILLAAWLSYLLFYWLLRIPAINLLFTYTTLTHAYRRYHEPTTSLHALESREEASSE